jgi:alpha-tubulin suppressor-like RCC1 family protein
MWGEWYNGAKQRALRHVDVPLVNDRVDKIVMGQFHALFLSREGKVFSWGDNTYGELGFGVDVKWKTNPEAVPCFNMIRCIDVDAGGRHSLVLDEVGNLYSFGDNSEGQCGIEINRAYDPVTIETKGMLGEDKVRPIRIFAGDAHSALVTNEGDLFAWGDNSEERLGIHTTSSIFRPTLVEDVMGRNICGIGLGGFFSIFVTGPKEHAIGNKDLVASNNNKIMKELIFSNFKTEKIEVDQSEKVEMKRQGSTFPNIFGFTKKKDDMGK